MGTHVETLSARRAPARAWVMIAAVVVLLAALGAGVLIGRATDTTKAAPASRPAGLASAEVVAAMDAAITSLNAGDTAGYADAFATDAVVTDTIAGIETTGAGKIASVYENGPTGGWQLKRVSEVVQTGEFAAYTFTYNGGSGVAVFQLNGDLQFVHQWLMGL